MEDSTLDRFKSGTRKLFGRTNERLKQKMGRAPDPLGPKDDKWAVLLANFNRQQAAGFRLHREVKCYIASLKTLENSTQTLLDAVREMHEYTWPGNMSLVKALQGLDKLNKEMNEVMVDAMLVPVNNYVETFPQVKDRMTKRNRKLLDYTRAKRNLDTLKKGEKISQDKLGFAQDDYTQQKMIYEEIHNELTDDLPEFWESRKLFIARFLEGFFKNNTDFHKEFAQVYTECAASVEPLREEIRSEPPPTREIGDSDRHFIVSEKARKFKRESLRRSFRKSAGSSFKRSLSMGALKKSKRESAPTSVSNLTVDPYAVPTHQAGVYTPTKSTPAKKENSSPNRPKPPRSPANVDVIPELDQDIEVKIELGTADSECEDPLALEKVVRRKKVTDDILSNEGIPFSPTIKVESGTVVESIHEYKAVDDDELTFGAGDVITVVSWDSTDEQDEGWFMGIIQKTGAKGAFPINYTRNHTPVRKRYSQELNKPEEQDGAFQNIDLGKDEPTTSAKEEVIPKTNGEVLPPARPTPPETTPEPVVAVSAPEMEIAAKEEETAVESAVVPAVPDTPVAEAQVEAEVEAHVEAEVEAHVEAHVAEEAHAEVEEAHADSSGAEKEDSEEEKVELEEAVETEAQVEETVDVPNGDVPGKEISEVASEVASEDSGIDKSNTFD